MNQILNFMIYGLAGANGPHWFSLIAAFFIVLYWVHSKKFGLAETFGFCLGIYYIHETVFEMLFSFSRAIQGIIIPFGYGNVLGFALIGLFLYMFRKRLKFSYSIIPFVILNAFWLYTGFSIDESTLQVNLIALAYSFSFLFAINGTLK